VSGLLAGIMADAGGYLIAAGVGLIAFIGAYMRGRLSGAQRERDRQAAKERDSYAKHIRDIERAADAGRAVRPDDGGMQSDPNNRDNAR
jgi:hypothetical protein